MSFHASMLAAISAPMTLADRAALLRELRQLRQEYAHSAPLVSALDRAISALTR